MSKIFAVLNVFTHELEGPFADVSEALRYIEKQDDPCGLTVLPMGTGKVREEPIVEIVRKHGPDSNKIRAIKELREHSHMSLKDAKHAVDLEWARQGFGWSRP